MNDGRPDWSDDRASALVGKYALIGLTFVDHDENIISQVQRHGRIHEADASHGIAIRLVAHGQHWDGEMYRLPPDLSAFVDAPPGEYRLRSTGEVVVNPDVTASWTIKSPPAEEDTPEKRRARAAEALRFGFETGDA
jgi:hypothetical protein